MIDQDLKHRVIAEVDAIAPAQGDLQSVIRRGDENYRSRCFGHRADTARAGVPQGNPARFFSTMVRSSPFTASA